METASFKRGRRDDRLVRWIADYAHQHQYAPSVREVGKAFDLKSSASIHAVLARLRGEGKIDWIEGETRTLHVINRV